MAQGTASVAAKPGVTIFRIVSMCDSPTCSENWSGRRVSLVKTLEDRLAEPEITPPGHSANVRKGIIL